jgi:hypothetical protein
VISFPVADSQRSLRGLPRGILSLVQKLESLLPAHGDRGASISMQFGGGSQQDVLLGNAVQGREAMRTDHLLQIASLSKTVGAAFLCEYCHANDVALTTPVNVLLRIVARRSCSPVLPSRMGRGRRTSPSGQSHRCRDALCLRCTA